MAQVTPVQIIAEGRVAVAVAGTPTFVWSRGCSAIATGGAGIVNITLENPADATNNPGTAAIANCNATANGFFVTTSRTDDNTVRFDVWSTTAAHADSQGFDFVVFQAPIVNA